MKLRSSPLIFSLLLVLLIAGTAVAERKAAPPAKPLTVAELPDFLISRGTVLYQRYCTFCHGESGRGDGLNAYLLPVKPANLGDQQLMAGKTDQDLTRIILQGGDAASLSPAMPSFAETLTPAEAAELVEHFRTAFKDEPSEETDDSNEL